MSKTTINSYLNRGYTIVAETKEHVTFEKPHKFRIGYFILWIILANGFGLVGYLIYHAVKKEKITVEK